MKIYNKDIQKFKTYIKNHVHIVELLGKTCYKKDFSNHDLDKQKAKKENEILFAKRNAKFNNKNLKLTKEELNKIDYLIGHHVKINKHHPEYWDDNIKEDDFDSNNPPVCHAEKMPRSALIEMCCDWAAVALKKNQPLDFWYNKTVDKRFFFTKSQKEFIKKQLKLLEESIIENDIRFPGINEKYSFNKINFKEAKMKTVALSFMRANPFTIGHMLICKQLHEINADKKCIYLSHSQDKPKKDILKCKNPLPYNLKVIYAKTFIADSPFKDVKIIESNARTILDALHELYLEGFEKVIIIVGSDRVEAFEELVNKYNNYINPEKEEIAYSFKNIEVKNAGDRNREGDSLSSMSASKLRKLAVEGNFIEFAKGVPSKNLDIKKDLYEDVRSFLGVI